MDSADRVANEHLEIVPDNLSERRKAPRRRSTVSQDDLPAWERIRTAVFDPNMPMAGYAYAMGESKRLDHNQLGLDPGGVDEYVHQAVLATPTSRRRRRVLRCVMWCLRPYKSTSADRVAEWEFGGAVDPECLWNRVWGALMFCAVVFQIYALLYAAAFFPHTEDKKWPVTLDVEMLVVDILYIIDIVYKQYLGYVDAGNKVMDLPSIRRAYWTSVWALVDVASALPVDWIALVMGLEPYAFRIPKLLRYIHIPATLGRWEQYLAVRRRFLSRIFMTMFYGFSLAHCMGMLWLYTARKYPTPSGFVPTDEQLALPDASLYLAAVYWGFGASVGTINPGEPAPGVQTWFAIFVSGVGVLFVAYTIGSVHRMVGHMQKSVTALRVKLNVVNQFMKHNEMPHELRDKVLRYHTFLHEVSGGRGAEEAALRQLPRCVRFELSYALVADTVRQVPLFQGCPESLLRSLVRLLQPIIAVSDEVVVEARSFVDTLYIVHWGRLAVTASSPKAHRSMGIRALEAVASHTLDPGSFFGQLDDSCPAAVTVTAVTFCHLYIISTDTLHKLLKVFPEAKDTFMYNRTTATGRGSAFLAGAGRDPEATTLVHRFLSNYVAPASIRTKSINESIDLGTVSRKRRRSSVTERLRWLTEARESVKHGMSASTVLSMRSMLGNVVEEDDLPIVIHPNSVLQRVRLGLNIVTVMYSCFAIPTAVVFSPGAPAWWVMLINYGIIDMVYLLDLLLSFRTAYVSRGTLVVDPRPIALQYLNTNFVWDLLAVFPLDLVWIFAGYSPWLRINRMVRIMHLNSWFEDMTLHSRLYLQLRLVKLLGLLLVAFHIAACMYFMFVRIDGFGNAEQWLPDGNVYENTSAWVQYSRALWFIVKPRGMGRHLNPHDDLSTAFSLLLQATGFVLYAYLIGNIGTLLTSADKSASAFRHRKELVEVFMEARKVPVNVRYHVLDFFKVQWDAMHGADPREAIKDLPVSLQTDVMYELCAKHIRRIRLFATASDDLLRSMVATIVVEMIPAYQTLFQAGDVGHAMYFVSRGTLEVLARNENDPHGAGGAGKGKDRGAEHIVTLGKGSFFGEGSLVYHRRVATVRSITACELLVWDFVHARAVMKRYPALWVKIKVIANRRRESVLFTRGGSTPAVGTTAAGLQFEDGVNVPLDDLRSRAQKLSVLAFLDTKAAKSFARMPARVPTPINMRSQAHQAPRTSLDDVGDEHVEYVTPAHKDKPYDINAVHASHSSGLTHRTHYSHNSHPSRPASPAVRARSRGGGPLSEETDEKAGRAASADGANAAGIAGNHHRRRSTGLGQPSPESDASPHSGGRAGPPPLMPVHVDTRPRPRVAPPSPVSITSAQLRTGALSPTVAVQLHAAIGGQPPPLMVEPDGDSDRFASASTALTGSGAGPTSVRVNRSLDDARDALTADEDAAHSQLPSTSAAPWERALASKTSEEDASVVNALATSPAHAINNNNGAVILDRRRRSGAGRRSAGVAPLPALTVAPSPGNDINSAARAWANESDTL